MVPVISPLAADDLGQVLNINADTVASTVARALEAEKLIFMTDTAGLLEDKAKPASLISYTDVKGLSSLQARGVVDSGMLPKVKAATEALTGGVREKPREIAEQQLKADRQRRAVPRGWPRPQADRALPQRRPNRLGVTDLGPTSTGSRPPLGPGPTRPPAAPR